MLFAFKYKYIRSYMITETYWRLSSSHVPRYKCIRSYMITETLGFTPKKSEIYTSVFDLIWSLKPYQLQGGSLVFKQVYSILYDHWNIKVSFYRNCSNIQVYSILYDHWNNWWRVMRNEKNNTSVFDLIWSLKLFVFKCLKFMINTSVFDLIWSLKRIIFIYSTFYDHTSVFDLIWSLKQF